MKIGKLTVIKKDIAIESKQKWICQCDCGKVTSVREDNLLKGYYYMKGGTRSCGCLNPIQNHCKGIKRVDRIGMIVNDYQCVLKLLPDSNRSYNYLYHDLTNNMWRVSDFRHVNALAHIPRYECKTAQEALKKYYHKVSARQFSRHANENAIMTMLLQNEIIWTKQYTFEDLKDKSALPFDIAVFNENDNTFQLAYLIEYDGEGHFNKIAHWDLQTTHKHDLMKNQYCFKTNIPLIRIPYDAEYTLQDLQLETTRYLLTPDNEKEYYQSRNINLKVN